MKNVVFEKFVDEPNREADFYLTEAIYKDSEALTLTIRVRDTIRAKSALRALRNACDKLLEDIPTVAGVYDENDIRSLTTEQKLDKEPPTAL